MVLAGEIEVIAFTGVDEAPGDARARRKKIDASSAILHLEGPGGGAWLQSELARSRPAAAERLGFITGGAVNDEEQAFVRKFRPIASSTKNRSRANGLRARLW